MSQINFNRIVYSPDVYVYILPGGKDAEPIDISNDIIEGSITRRTEAVSTASFLIQSRRNSDNDMLLSTVLRPMDRIVIYLKKTKPILIFSGYLDLVPVFQAMPEPFTIEASCTLKRLEFTYWDPNLPNVYETLQKYGFIPKVSESGVSFFEPSALSPADVGTTPSANGPQTTSGDFPQDTGFGAMLHFLLVDVGGWNPDNVWIEPIPEAWMKRAALLFKVNNDWEDRYQVAQEWLKTFLTAGGSSGGDGGGDNSGGGSADLENATTIAGKIQADINNRVSNSPMKAEDFIDAGKKNNIDPRFLAALAASETSYGTAPNSSADVNNAFGYKNSDAARSGSGTYYTFSSFRDGVLYVADVLRHKHYYIGEDNNQNIDGFLAKWNLSSGHQKEVLTNIWKSLETETSPVDINKPYSITGQKIGAARLNETEPPSSNENNPSATTGGSNKILSVYLEAGHSGTGGIGAPSPNTTMQPGYQMQPGATKVGGDYTEPQQNAAFIKAMKRAYNALSENDKKRLDIQFATETSRPRGWAGDVYLSIHHDPASFSGSSIGIAGPSSISKQGTQSSTNASPPGKPGEPGPNRYADGGAGFVKPSDGEGGRDTINNDSGLHKNSAQLISFIGSKVRGLTAGDNFINDLTRVSGNTWNRMQNYYGFYYTNSSAAAIVELPSTTSQLKYDRDKLAEIFIKALLDYQKLYKEKGNQATISAGSEAIGGGTINTGDDSPASKVIKAALKLVSHNEANWDIGYSMEDRSPYADVEEVLRKKGNLDCSSFIAACMKSAKLIPKSTYAYVTGDLEDGEQIPDKNKFKPGMLFIRHGSGGAGHVAMVVDLDGKCVECTRPDQSANKGPNRGPQFKRTAQDFISDSGYNLWRNSIIGDTENPPSSFGVGDSEGEGGTGSVDSYLQAKTVAFNVAFNFPGSLLESVLLTGDRALENDVKLLESVGEICKSSMRTFASLPNGDFMAWYPDYFNLSGRNPWLKVSTTEIKSCTISLSDRQLVTHVYVLGNPFGLNQDDASNIRLEWYEKLMGSGVVTIERPFILDSFLRPFEDENITQQDLETLDGVSELSPDELKEASKRSLPVLEGQGSVYKFLERYGARPYLEKIPTIRHPIFEFFYAYHTFIQKWAEQYVSRVELTFMPELFPGMIIELEVNPQVKNHPKTSVTFYVKEVTHSFSYQNGFYTEALLMAPGTTNKGNDWAMVLVTPPEPSDEKERAKRFRIKKLQKTPPKNSRRGGSRTTRRQNTNPGNPSSAFDPTNTEDGE